MKEEIYFVTGTAGTGKTTIMRALSERGVETIGVDEEPGLTTWIHKETGEVVMPGVELTDNFLNTHDWGCNIALLQERIAASKKPVVVCGSCDNVADVIKLCGKTMVLVCEPEVFLPRILQRTDNEYGKSEVAQQQILGYYKKYRDECLSLDAVPIEASNSVEEVLNEVLQHIK